MAKSNTKIGDIFSVKIDDNIKRYFQLIAFDLTQLNSDVVRVFKTVYPINANPDLSEVIGGHVEFYAHCVTRVGVNLAFWESVGNLADVGNITHILFRDTNDYGLKVGEESIKVSVNWYVWRINDKDFNRVGKLTDEHRSAHVGIIFNPLGIIEILKGNKYPVNYPGFE